MTTAAAITLGITTPLSGATAGPGTCTVAGVKAYFGAKNAEGGVKFGDGKTRREKRRIVRGTFQNVACNAVSLFWAPCVNAANVRQFVEVDESNRDWFHQIQGRGKGVIFRRGEVVRTVDESEMVTALIEEIDKWDAEVAVLASSAQPNERPGGFAAHRLLHRVDAVEHRRRALRHSSGERRDRHDESKRR